MSQSAYQQGISCADAIFATQEAFLKLSRKVDCPYLCLYDLEKAFDTIEHATLLSSQTWYKWNELETDKAIENFSKNNAIKIISSKTELVKFSAQATLVVTMHEIAIKYPSCHMLHKNISQVFMHGRMA